LRRSSRIIGRAVPLVHAARRPGDPPVLVAHASLARKLIGFTPRLSDLDTIVTTAWIARVELAPIRQFHTAEKEGAPSEIKYAELSVNALRAS
jgi:hypothetical protein